MSAERRAVFGEVAAFIRDNWSKQSRCLDELVQWCERECAEPEPKVVEEPATPMRRSRSKATEPVGE